MSQSPHSGNGAKVEGRDNDKLEQPMDRFKILAKRLLNVPIAEARDEERKQAKFHERDTIKTHP